MSGSQNNYSIAEDGAGCGRVGLHRLAIMTAGATFILIFAGGLVTSTGSALAVPDWPLSFGKFFPKMEGGVLYEHGHRMIAGVVAILTLALTIWIVAREPRRWVKNLALGAMGLIIVQAVLGGLTVLFRLPLAIAVAHAATAQAFFCLTVALALVTGPHWETVPHYLRDAKRPGLPFLAAVTTILIYAQILIGAVMRHRGAGLAIPDFPLAFGAFLPVLKTFPRRINFAHRAGAVVVLIFVSWTVIRVVRFHRERSPLIWPALTLAALLVVQISLGAETIWSGRAVIPATAHVAVGAAVLACALIITLWAFRLSELTASLASVESEAVTPDRRTASGGAPA